MAGMKSLAKDTAIYGLSSILGRFLNWCFVFLYINVLKTTAEYGIVTNTLIDRKSTRLNSSHVRTSRMPSSA